MLSLRGQAVDMLQKDIGNGDTTSLWFDKWLSEGRLVDLLPHETPYTTHTVHWKVSNLIKDGHWDVSMAFLSPFANTITAIPISANGDRWRWLPSSDGIFSFSTAWEQVRECFQQFQLYNVVWFPSTNPKMACCLLKGLKNRLATRDRLFRFGITTNEQCVLCQNGKESRDHLFFRCPFSEYLWTLCKLKLYDTSSIEGMEEEALKIKLKFKKKDRIFKLARLSFTVTVWHIWQERNRRIFQNQQMHKVLVFRRIYEDINVLLRTCNRKVGNEDILASWGL